MDNLFAHILDAAQRAPSPHNTQPWKLKWDKDGLDIFISQNRMIPAVDPTSADILHSLGAMLENILLTLEHLGFEPKYEVAEQICCDTPMIRLTWRKSDKPLLKDDLYYQIPLRRTSRLAYLKEQVEEKKLLELQSYLLTPCKIYWTQDSDKILSIRKLVAFATVEQLKDQKIATELYDWTRFSSRDPRWYRDGLNTVCMGWGKIESAIYKVLLHPKMLTWISKLSIFDKLYYSEAQAAPFSPAVILLTMPTLDNPQNRILAGRSLQRLWLAAAYLGLVTHPISAGVDVLATQNKIKTLLNVLSDEPHVNLFRLGKSVPCARSPRLTVEEMIAENSI